MEVTENEKKAARLLKDIENMEKTDVIGIMLLTRQVGEPFLIKVIDYLEKNPDKERQEVYKNILKMADLL